MKINMLMRYLKIEDLFSEEPLLKKLWELFEDIRKSLIIDGPSASTSINFDPKDGEKLKILKQLEKKEGVLKISKIGSDSVSIKVKKNKFNLLYKKIEREIEKLDLKRSQSVSKSSMKVGPDKFITKIICVDPGQKNKFKVVLNNDYENFIEGDKAKKCWYFLFQIAEEEFMPYQEEYKTYIDYFNSNKKNRIYTQTEYNIAKIFEIERGTVVPNIPMNIISEKAFQTRLKKAET